MGKPEDLDYPFYQTLFEVFDELRLQIDLAKSAEGMTRLGIRLTMAESALKCATKIYDDRVVEMQKEKVDAKV